MTKYDVRRTIQIRNPVTGNQVVEALQQLALAKDEKTGWAIYGGYREECLSDVDGRRVLDVGFKSSYPQANVAIKTGESLSEGIELDRSYERIGVVSTKLPMGVPIFAVGYDESSVVKAVEAVKTGLENLLNR